jgi:hypothetical protein
MHRTRALNTICVTKTGSINLFTFRAGLNASFNKEKQLYEYGDVSNNREQTGKPSPVATFPDK